jgi:acyl carrier protein
MTEEAIQSALLNFITRNFMVTKEEINLENSMIDEGIIDSFGLIEIVAFMETEFCLVVEDDHMNRDNFGSVLKIVDYIHRQIMMDGYKKSARQIQ